MQLRTVTSLVVLAALAPYPALAQSGSVLSIPSNRTLPDLGSSAPSSPLAKFEPEGNRVYHGASVPDTWNDAGLRQQVAQYQKYAGKRISVVTWFASVYQQGRMTSWRNEYAGPLDRVRRAGALSLIKFSVQDAAYDQNHKMAGLKQVAAGTYDAYFEEAAAAVKDFGGPVFLSINHEMNGTWYPYSEGYAGSGVTAADFIAAWRHIVDIFRRKGADNAAFVWSPNVPDVGPVPFTKYYPGDAYVDWIGASFYSGNPMENLDTIYRAYAAKKPIFITEWATGEDKSKYYQGYPGDAKWIDMFFKTLERRYPRVKAISWFQWDKSTYGESNYQLQRSPDQQQVYAADIQSPRYLDSPGPLGGKVANAIEIPRLEVTPNEIVLKEAVKTEAPRSAPPAPRIKLHIVPLEPVRTER